MRITSDLDPLNELMLLAPNKAPEQELVHLNYGCLASRKSTVRNSRRTIHGYRRPLCTYPNCLKGSRGAGLCGAHGGGKRCAVKGCLKALRKQQLCFIHYQTS